MPADLDHDDPVAIAASAGMAFVLEAHHRPVLDPRGELEVDGLAIGEGNALVAPGGSLGEGHREPVLDIRAALGRGRRGLATKAAPRTGLLLRVLASAEQTLEQVAKIDFVSAVAAEIAAISRPAAGASAISAAAPVTGPSAHARKGIGGIAVSVDLAPVILRALGLVRQQIIGARHFGEFLRRVGLVLVAIGMQLLGELAIGALDVGLGGRAGYAEQGIKIAHGELAR